MLRNFWNVWFTFFFIFLASVAIGWLAAVGRLPETVSLLNAVLIALAVFRLTRLTVYDNITAFIRAWFSGTSPETFRGTIHTLITCPWCIGLWYALVVSFLFFVTPYAWFPIFFLAVAGIATFMQLIANLIGWHAEGKKIDVQSRM